jgi:hypothetical protein
MDTKTISKIIRVANHGYEDNLSASVGRVCHLWLDCWKINHIPTWLEHVEIWRILKIKLSTKIVQFQLHCIYRIYHNITYIYIFIFIEYIYVCTTNQYYIYIHIMCMYIYIDTSTILCREPPPPCLPLWWPLLHCEAAAVILERMAFSTSRGRIEKNGMTNGFIYMNMV